MNYARWHKERWFQRVYSFKYVFDFEFYDFKNSFEFYNLLSFTELYKLEILLGVYVSMNL